MRGRALLLVACAGLLGFAPAPLPRQERRRDDLADFNGTWVFVRCETNGVADPPETLTPYRIEIRRNEITFIPKEGAPSRLGMALDPAASPPSFTWSIDGKVSFVGSYRLRNGELTMIFAMGDRAEDRPKDFDAAEATMVLKRKKK